MEPFPWQASYASGVTEIDEQHASLISLLNSLGTCIERQNTDAVRLVWQPMLQHYAEAHFAFEEKVMLETQYPDLLAHCACHSDLRERARAVVADDGDPLACARAMHALVFEWFVEHLVGRDGAFGRWLAAHPDTLQLRREGPPAPGG